MLTGAMCAIEPGSPLQLVIALLCCLAYMLLVLFAGPCKFFFAGLFLNFFGQIFVGFICRIDLDCNKRVALSIFFLCSVLFVGVF